MTFPGSETQQECVKILQEFGAAQGDRVTIAQSSTEGLDVSIRRQQDNMRVEFDELEMIDRVGAGASIVGCVCRFPNIVVLTAVGLPRAWCFGFPRPCFRLTASSSCRRFWGDLQVSVARDACGGQNHQIGQDPTRLGRQEHDGSDPRGQGRGRCHSGN